MHFHHVPQEPDDSISTYCADHIPAEDFENGLLYLCDCESRSGACVICEEDRPICPVCGCDPTEHNWETHTLEIRNG